MQANTDIQAVRHAALNLHKVLIQAVRLDYERAHGRVENPTKLWQLVLYDTQFAWLRPLSQWLVALDDSFDASANSGEDVEPTASELIGAAVGGRDQASPIRGLEHSAAVRGELESLLSDPEWSERYVDLLQHVPEVVLAHANLQQQLQRLPANEREPMFS